MEPASYEQQWLPEERRAPASSVRPRGSSIDAHGPTKGSPNIESGSTSTPRKSMKEMTKAERRALQEKQRAEKAAKAAASATTSANKKGGSSDATGQDSSPLTKAKPRDKENKGKSSIAKLDNNDFGSSSGSKQVALLAHLAHPTRPSTSPPTIADIHPAVLTLGLLFSEHKITGSNARCVATLSAFKKVIQEYRTPEGTTLSRHLQTVLNSQIQYLVDCRNMSVSMGTAIRYLKMEISTVDIDLSDEEAKMLLCQKIDNFIRERITIADKAIIAYGLQKIHNGDIILTYAKSSVVEALILEAHKMGIQFSVVILDSRPKFEGKNLLKNLVTAGIKCTYCLLHSCGFAFRHVSKVFLGCHAVLSNGALYSRVGTAMVAMMAKDLNIPVIVCCETYKFTDRVQLDSFVWNEEGDPSELVNISANPIPKPGPLSSWLGQPDLKLLNILYDVTPSKYITMVITEVGMIPCTSVPVVLREYKAMIQL
ncbi:10981_t:CDS:2 [Paraglomus brasilianum]|uniref:Translation initiation factor eIF2B subunit delta n=1 Tax=Paraglomus brasilianum TaxID=144538 RepID=A0A9N9F5I9_9GLOM|nr:10981_t:CDS:2 [Paraglomus brasilianum]